MILKPIDEHLKTDIELLVASQVRECRTIDYKLALPGGTDNDKKELLADVSSFANAAGGDLLFGISEAGGVPIALPGLAGINLDAEKLRLESIIRDGIQPRIPGIQMREIVGFPSGPVLLVRIPKSWVSPHMVTFKGTSRFFTRNSAGKYSMDVGELRNAFAASELLGERMQRFRTDRLSKIIAAETPVPMVQSPKSVLHILPFSSFALASYIDQRMQDKIQMKLRPIGSGGGDHRHNLDGFLTYSVHDGGFSDGYCQFFRSGVIEAVSANLVFDVQGRRCIGSTAYEMDLVKALRPYLALLNEIGVPTPVLVTLSMIGVKGAYLHTGQQWFRVNIVGIDRDVLLLPDVIVERFDADPTMILRPIFDAVWNAAGFERSFNYDDQGAWHPQR